MKGSFKGRTAIDEHYIVRIGTGQAGSFDFAVRRPVRLGRQNSQYFEVLLSYDAERSKTRDTTMRIVRKSND